MPQPYHQIGAKCPYCRLRDTVCVQEDTNCFEEDPAPWKVSQLFGPLLNTALSLTSFGLTTLLKNMLLGVWNVEARKLIARPYLH